MQRPHGEPVFDPATLPKVEDLTATSDITAFLRKGVPEELKRLALRRVWTLDPQIRDFIEVAENQYDWNAADGVPGFGALPEGTDLQALLAQATGQVREIVVADASRFGGFRGTGAHAGGVPVQFRCIVGCGQQPSQIKRGDRNDGAGCRASGSVRAAASWRRVACDRARPDIARVGGGLPLRVCNPGP